MENGENERHCIHEEEQQHLRTIKNNVFFHFHLHPMLITISEGGSKCLMEKSVKIRVNRKWGSESAFSVWKCNSGIN